MNTVNTTTDIHIMQHNIIIIFYNIMRRKQSRGIISIIQCACNVICQRGSSIKSWSYLAYLLKKITSPTFLIKHGIYDHWTLDQCTSQMCPVKKFNLRGPKRGTYRGTFGQISKRFSKYWVKNKTYWIFSILITCYDYPNCVQFEDQALFRLNVLRSEFTINVQWYQLKLTLI